MTDAHPSTPSPEHTALPDSWSALADFYAARGWQAVPCQWHWQATRERHELTPLPGTTGSRASFGATGNVSPTATVAAHPDDAWNNDAYVCALRPPEHVVLLDVDAGYGDKQGDATLAAVEAAFGELPATYRITARGAAHPSRKLVYRFDGDARALEGLFTAYGGCVEVVRTGHRFSWAPPTVHVKQGVDVGTVACYGPDGGEVDVPDVRDGSEAVPWLPDAYAQAAQEASNGSNGTESAEDAASTDDYVTPAHAERIVADSVERLHAATWDGEYRSALWNVARVVAKVEAARGNDGAVVYERVASIVAQHPEPHIAQSELDEDDRQWIAEGANKGYARPFVLYDEFAVLGANGSGSTGDSSSGAHWFVYDALQLSTVFDPTGSISDYDLADAVAQRAEPVLRYARDSGEWLQRGALKWSFERNAVKWAISALVPTMPKGAPPLTGKDKESASAHDWREAARFKRRELLASAKGLDNVSRYLTAQVSGELHPLSVRLTDLDARADVLWAGGAAWSLREWDNGPVATNISADTPHMVTANYEPCVTPTPLWDRLTRAVWPNDDECEYALNVLAVAFTGYSYPIVPVLQGPTHHGKSYVVGLLSDLLGDYAIAANPKLFTTGQNDHDVIILQLKGARLVAFDEGLPEGHWALERFKRFTGSNELTGRNMGAQPVTFDPTHTIVLMTNDVPTVTDPALFARIRLLLCDGEETEIHAAEQALGNAHDAAWKAEAPGVLADMMRRASEWLNGPEFPSTGAVPDRTAAVYAGERDDQSEVKAWIAECCEEVMPEDSDLTSTLLASFSAWRYRMNMGKAPSVKTFAAWLRDAGYERVRLEQRNVYPLRVRRGTGSNDNGVSLPPGGTIDLQPEYKPVFFSDNRDTTMRPQSETRDQPGTNSEQAATESTETLEGCPRGWKVAPEPSSIVSAGQHTFPGRLEGLEGLEGKEVSGENREEKYIHVFPVGTGWRFASDLPAGSEKPRLTSENDEAQPSSRANNLPAGRGGVEETAGHGATPDRVPVRTSDNAKRSKAGTARDAERARLVAERAGGSYALPCVVSRDGSINAVDVAVAAATVKATVSQHGAMTVDVETTGYPVGHTNYALRTVQLGTEALAVVFDATDDAQRDAVRSLLSLDVALHAHSATADIIPLAVAGLADAPNLWQRMHDTVITAKLADPTMTGSDPGLKKLAPALLGKASVVDSADAARKSLFQSAKWLTNTGVDTPVERSGWAQVDSACETMVHYAASDVLDTAAIARRLASGQSERVVERERLAQRMCANVTQRGLLLDVDHIRVLRDEHEQGMGEVAHVWQDAGINNPNSTQQVARAFERHGVSPPLTDAGNPSVKATALDDIAAGEGPAAYLARAMTTHRYHRKALDAFVLPYLALCEHGDGRMRPTIYTLGTDTGRFSSVRPNVQQLPREGGVRRCVRADSGEVIVSADFSSVEVRVAAALSQDATLMELIASEDAATTEDEQRYYNIHWRIARAVFGQDASKAERYIAKRGVFGRIYGGGVETLAQQVGTDATTMQRVIDQLDAIAPGVARWSAGVRREVESGQRDYTLYSGRVLHHDVSTSYKAPNWRVQGTARELLVDTLMRWLQTKWGGCTLIPVHDELLVFVPEADAHAATEALIQCMETTLFGVRIVADPSEPSPYWQDAT